MTTAAPSTALATIQPIFTDAERLALAGFYKYAVEEELLEHSRPPMSGGRGWTTNLTLSRWIATSSAPFSWPPVSARRLSMR